MVQIPNQIGFLDSENMRGSLYADILDGPFQIADLYPPFSPSRYAAAIKEFQDAGVKVLVIDTTSHEWEGEGGCDDIANKKIGNMPNWIGAKREHKSFMNTLLQSNMHIICCLRAREKTDFKDPRKPVSLGIQPICEKNFMFEMTASILMGEEGKKQTFIKMPAFLLSAFGNGSGYLGEGTGRKIMEWVNTGGKEDPQITKIKAEMLQACEWGLDGVISIWNNLNKAQKVKLKDHKEVCKEAALEYERQQKEANETPQEALKERQQQSGSQIKMELP